ncbi:TetR/AcrR family transcriptional regulator [Nocardia huaxiensis]|uniref:TetR/AcrR family transcriptional regulator n=2 Tax=Nocardia huaxiensis TaxID=2755382 RepID=A0A7D6VGL4_9NOCA|nr:TetR/AcrR family transcriptional regulator [Nocardia huaxiensis]
MSTLDSEGYDAIQLREIARRAKVSLATIYKHFPTRDLLVVAAIEVWMAANTYAELEPPDPREPLCDGLIRLMRHVFRPWEQHPAMLTAYHRARSGPGGQRLDNQGLDAVVPVAAQVVAGADPAYVEDIASVLSNMAYSLLGQCADGTRTVADILPILERAAVRLTSNNAADAAAVLAHRQPRNGRGVPAISPDIAAPYYRRPAD